MNTTTTVKAVLLYLSTSRTIIVQNVSLGILFPGVPYKQVRTAIKVSVMTSVTSQAQQYSQRKLQLKR